MNMPELMFDNSNNACHSLRLLAELVRAQDFQVLRYNIGEEDGVVRVDLVPANHVRKRRNPG